MVDDLGNVTNHNSLKEFKKGSIKTLSFKIIAIDPQGLTLHYQFLFSGLVSRGDVDWTTNNIATISVLSAYTGYRNGSIRVDNQDNYGCIGAYYDDQVYFSFSVLP